MKPGKTLLIITFIIIVLIIIAFLVNQSNKKKTAAALNNQTTPDANITGRFVAISSIGTDYTEIVNGKPKWLWSGKSNCSSDYTKILTGANAGWCILSTEFNKSMPPKRSLESGKKWCCAQFDTSGNCTNWEQRDSNSTCANNA